MSRSHADEYLNITFDFISDILIYRLWASVRFIITLISFKSMDIYWNLFCALFIIYFGKFIFNNIPFLKYLNLHCCQLILIQQAANLFSKYSTLCLILHENILCISLLNWNYSYTYCFVFSFACLEFIYNFFYLTNCTQTNLYEIIKNNKK